MAFLMLRLELAEPYQACGRALDMARKMGFELVRMRLDRVGPSRHRLDLGLCTPRTDLERWESLFHRLEGIPGIGKVTWDGCPRRATGCDAMMPRPALARDGGIVPATTRFR